MEEEKKMTALNPAVGAAGKRSFIDKNVNDILPEGSTEFNIFREIRSKVSAREAAEYYGIGEKRLRRIAADNVGEVFVMEVGSQIRIKRELFEQFLNSSGTI